MTVKARTTMNEATLIIILFAAIAYGPWLLDCIVREYRIRKAHYA